MSSKQKSPATRVRNPVVRNNDTRLSRVKKTFSRDKRVEDSLIQGQYLLNNLVDNITDHIYFKDLKSRFIRINKRMTGIFGLTDPEQAVGRTDFDFFTAEHAQQAYDDEQKIIQTGEPLLGIEEKETWPDGHETWVSTTKMPLRNKAEEIVGTFGISRDVTVQKQAQEELKKLAAKLEVSNRELESFASVASHDLQEPLRKIQAFSEMLKTKHGETLPAEGRDYLDRMQNAATRMRALIEDLLTFSRVTSGARPFVPVDVATVAREVMSDLEVRIDQFKARVEIGDLPVMEADPMQIRQLLQNLTGNALKFHRENEPPVVRIQSRALTEPSEFPPGGNPDQGFCLITVEDNGIGFDEKYLDRIFDIFQRLHGRGQYEGNGVGLAVCRKIVERHGGRITARSAPGKGTTFMVTLPLKQLKEEEAYD